MKGCEVAIEQLAPAKAKVSAPKQRATVPVINPSDVLVWGPKGPVLPLPPEPSLAIDRPAQERSKAGRKEGSHRRSYRANTATAVIDEDINVSWFDLPGNPMGDAETISQRIANLWFGGSVEKAERIATIVVEGFERGQMLSCYFDMCVAAITNELCRMRDDRFRKSLIAALKRRVLPV